MKIVIFVLNQILTSFNWHLMDRRVADTVSARALYFTTYLDGRLFARAIRPTKSKTVKFLREMLPHTRQAGGPIPPRLPAVHLKR